MNYFLDFIFSQGFSYQRHWQFTRQQGKRTLRPEASVFWVILVRIFPHSEYPYLSAFSPNAGKYGPESNSDYGHFLRSGQDHFYSSLPLPPIQKHSDINLKLCWWDDYVIFLLTPLVPTRLLLDEIYSSW